MRAPRRGRPRTYPQIRGTQPLVDVIKAPEWARPAVRQVFGRFLVCSSLELCDEVSRKHGLDAVTLDGDKAGRIPRSDAARATLPIPGTPGTRGFI